MSASDSSSAQRLDVVLVGGGMIAHDQILPSLYHLQRLAMIGEIRVVARRSALLRELASSDRLLDAFPDQTFSAFPSLETPPDRLHPELYRQVIAAQAPGNLVVVAVPDHVHDEVIRCALEHDQHVLAVKPLVPTFCQAAAIDELARHKGLFVGIEYHKRFDRRSLDARHLYRAGRFGEFRCGEAKMIEPFYYRHSNFQNWFTKDQSDPFTYVGCHYVDLVYFITGLKPIEVSVRGVEGRFPNGNVGYMWAQGRVVWENGALLSITNGLGYPDLAAGTNDQGLVMYCEGDDCGAVIKHDDQYRGVRHGYTDDASGARFRFVSPDYFRLVPWDGPGLKPVGYGFDSIEALVAAAKRIRDAGAGLDAERALTARRAMLRQINDRSLLATPANSWINELVSEAARLSILRDGHPAVIQYEPAPAVQLRS